MKYRRIKRHVSPQVKALADAQKIAFAPFTFQAVASMLDLGILDFLQDNPAGLDEIIETCKVSRYTAETLLETALCAGIISKNNDLYSNTAVADAFLNNEMTKVNFNFVKDVCYLGASELTQSFRDEEPAGLKKFIGEHKTIYEILQILPQK